VSASSQSRSVAGSIAHTARLGLSPTLLATGQTSVNTAVKAIAIARDYLTSEAIELTASPLCRQREQFEITVTRSAASSTKPAAAASTFEVRVATTSDPGVVAGAIAKKVREGERVSIMAIGSSCVCIAMSALAFARRYLQSDNLDLSFRPEFEHVEVKDGETRSALRIIVLAQQI